MKTYKRNQIKRGLTYETSLEAMGWDLLGKDYQLVVVYDYHPPSYGSKEAGVPIEPDEPEGIEINTIYLDLDESGDFIEINAEQAELEQLGDKILEGLMR